ncbi:MAG: SGNH/GDSL hydrolase family protein [Streptosporangiaceae bacterium]
MLRRLAGATAVLAAVLAVTAAGAAVAGTWSRPPQAKRPAGLAGSGRNHQAAVRAAGPARVTQRSGQAGPGRQFRRVHATRQDRLLTSCRSVAHIGDSTSVDLISPLDIPGRSQRLGARYAAVGVRHVRIDASGGRSIVETLPGQVNGYNVARAWRAQGYHGCWVFALGTNDAANIAAGAAVGDAARIDLMMSAAHGQPVLWVNTRTMLTSGPWANANEQRFNQALVQALARYPNLRIFDWSAVARPAWFLADGIHYNSVGVVERARAIADALARAFPRDGRPGGRIVR